MSISPYYLSENDLLLILKNVKKQQKEKHKNIKVLKSTTLKENQYCYPMY